MRCNVSEISKRIASIRRRWIGGRVQPTEDIHDVRNDPMCHRPGSVTRGVDKFEHRRSAMTRTGDHTLERRRANQENTP